MIGSMGSVVVAGEAAAGAGPAGGFPVPDSGGRREDSLQDAGGESGASAAAVAFEVELSFEGLVHGFDDLTERFEESLTAWGFSDLGVARSEVMPAVLSPLIAIMLRQASRSSVSAPVRAKGDRQA